MENNYSMNEIKNKFLKVYEKSPQLYDREDFERVMKNEFFIKRYLWHHSMDEQKALQMLLESLKWRKEFGVNAFTDSYFPKEFYECGAVFPYCPDKNGLITLYLRIKMIKKIPELKSHYKKFLIHNINKIDLEANGKGWVLVVDASGAGISNCDLELLIFLITTLVNNFPAAIQYILINSVPFALNGFWKIAKTFIPSDRLDMIRFTTNKDINQYIPSESLPDFLGGSAKLDYKSPPIESPNAFEFGTKTVGLPIEKVQKIVNSYKQFLENK